MASSSEGNSCRWVPLNRGIHLVPLSPKCNDLVPCKCLCQGLQTAIQNIYTEQVWRRGKERNGRRSYDMTCMQKNTKWSIIIAWVEFFQGKDTPREESWLYSFHQQEGEVQLKSSTNALQPFRECRASMDPQRWGPVLALPREGRIPRRTSIH